MLFNNFTVIGAGLIGSSLLVRAKECKLAKNFYIIEQNIDVNQNRYLSNISDNLFFDISKYFDFIKQDDAKTQLSLPDIIIIATPISAYESIIKKLSEYNDIIIKNKIIISDVGSVKHYPYQISKKYLPLNNIILSHPIAGSDKSGIGITISNLFDNKKVILLKRTKSNYFDIVKKLWQHIGSEIIYLDSKEHDKIFAFTSHLIQLLAFRYQELLSKNSLLLKSHQDNLDDFYYQKFIRLTNSNKELWKDIFFYNQFYLNKYDQKIKKNLAYISNLILKENYKKLITRFSFARNLHHNVAKQSISEEKLDRVKENDLDNLSKIMAILINLAVFFDEKTINKNSQFLGSGFKDFSAILNIIQYSNDQNIIKYIQLHKEDIIRLLDINKHL